MKATQPDSHFGEQATVRSKIRTKTEWTTWQPNERKLFERNPPHQVPNRRYRWTSQERLTGNKTLKCQNDGESVQRKTKSFKISGFWSLERTSYLRYFFIEFHIETLSFKSYYLNQAAFYPSKHLWTICTRTNYQPSCSSLKWYSSCTDRKAHTRSVCGSMKDWSREVELTT